MRCGGAPAAAAILIAVAVAAAAAAAASVARADDNPLTFVREWHVQGGIAAAATCVVNAPASEGGPTGGTLRLTGIPPGARIESAILYWSVLSALTPIPPGAAQLDGAALLAETVAELDDTPCFPAQSRTGIFRADVTPLVAGDATHVVSGLPFEDGVTFTEGATLVVVACWPGGESLHVRLWDGVDVTRGERPPFRQSLGGFTASSAAPVAAELLVVAGNGQGRDPIDSDVDPLVFQGIDLDAIDRTILSGASCPPLGLYDLTLLDVTGMIPAGGTSAQLQVEEEGDCHSIGAVLLAVAEDGVGGGGGGGSEPSAIDRFPSREPLRVAKRAGALELTWEDAGGPYDVHAGSIGGFYDHGSAACDLALPRASLPMPANDVYYLVVSTGCGGDSSCGRDSSGAERPSIAATGGVPCR